ncbi:MAG TPA: hypothetical protein VGB97_00010 [Candidatus Paceibacterota bacterium]
MVHRGTTRESKTRRERNASTPIDKARRHRNKLRIWRRATKRLEARSREVAPEYEKAPHQAELFCMPALLEGVQKNAA